MVFEHGADALTTVERSLVRAIVFRQGRRGRLEFASDADSQPLLHAYASASASLQHRDRRQGLAGRGVRAASTGPAGGRP